jgi:hypothetical protein
MKGLERHIDQYTFTTDTGARTMDYTQGHNAAQVMERVGGSFERNLALTYYRADSTNAQRLRNAFPEIFEKYLKWYEDDLKKSAERNPFPCY